MATPVTAPAPDRPAPGGPPRPSCPPATLGTTVLLPAALAALSWGIGWALVGPLLESRPVLWSLLPTLLTVPLRLGLRRVAVVRPPGSLPVVTLLLVHQVVVVAMVATNPFACIYAFLGYADADRHLTGLAQPLWIGVTGVTCAFGQAGSIPGVSGLPWMFVVLAAVNLGVAGVMVRAERAREREVTARERAAEELARVTRDNVALHERLLEQARATGVAQERARLSREIHDTVAQGLVAVIRQLEALPDGLDPAVAERVGQAEEAARECLVEARDAVEALSPHQLTDRSLEEALADLVRRWARRHRIVTELDTDDAPGEPAHRAVLLRVAQEGLANVAAHARASTVRVRLAAHGDRTLLEVDDDGVGFDPATVVRGRGLDGMAERVRAVGGELELGPRPGGGSTVRATVPAEVAR